jgi:spore germination cell wall hydrolase CwlJ-like protein
MLSPYEEIVAALCVWREARGESHEAQLGVAWVIRNRCHDELKRWPQDAVGVVTQRLQFSSFNANDPNVTKWPRLDDKIFETCRFVVREAFDNPTGVDPTKSANHYESLPLSSSRPNWAEAIKMTTRIGAFRFYKL